MVYKQAWSIKNYRYVGDVSASCSMFHGKVFVPLGFSRRREFIGGGVMPGGGPGGHTTWWHCQGVARATLWCDRLLVRLRLSSGLRLHVSDGFAA
jgi:hypothetical protein